MNNRVELDNYQDMNILNEMELININKPNNNLTGPYEGYIKGNLFKGLYNQYKNYKPAKLIPTNEQAELLLNINQVDFAIHDIRLYLDNNPNDKEMINLFNKYQIQLKKAIDDYEDKFGPVSIESLSKENIFDWVAYSWPWEREEN